MKNFPSIKRNSDFRNVYKLGIWRTSESMVMYAYDNGTDCGRIGISVSRKFGNSVRRHCFVRRIRAIYINNILHIKDGKDIVVVARRSAGNFDYDKLEMDYLRLLKQLRIYR